METWINGASGGTVQKIIDKNFSDLETAINRLSDVYVKNFTTEEWTEGAILISRSYYNKTTPVVELYMKRPTGYEAVLGGYEITSNGVKLHSDMAYDGKVVIR